MSDVASPCIGVCRMDDATGLCAGCSRTLDEIARWSAMAEADRREVWRAIDRRRVEHRRRLAAAVPANPPGP